MPKVIDPETGEVTRLPYEEGGVVDAAVRYPTKEAAQEHADTFDDATGATAVTQEMTEYTTGGTYWVVVPGKAVDLEGYFKESAEVRKATGKNMGGVVVDELGYMNGGATYTKRGPIKYSKGGAVRGKTFSGSY